jgi:Protein of unknown function (DUF3108)
LGTLQYTVIGTNSRRPNGAIARNGKLRPWRRTAAALCVASALGLSLLAQRSPMIEPSEVPRQESQGRTNSPAPTVIPPTPFRGGERLEFSGDWLGISGAISAQVALLEQRSFFGTAAWHFQAKLHTNNPLRILVPVDDQFDSYAAQKDMLGLQFEMYLHESGKSEAQIFRLSSAAEAIPANGATIVKVPPGTRDPLGFLYFLRTVSWERSGEVRGPVYEGHKLYEVRAQTLPTATIRTVKVPAGTFPAWSIGVRLYDRGIEVPGTKMTLWIAQDAARMPVLLELALPLGSSRVELVEATGN